MHDPIAYTYEADFHCPGCAEARFGRGADGFIASESTDSEGNPVGVVAPWDEWWSGDSDAETALYCDTCGGEIDRVTA